MAMAQILIIHPPILISPSTSRQQPPGLYVSFEELSLFFWQFLVSIRTSLLQVLGSECLHLLRFQKIVAIRDATRIDIKALCLV